MGGGTSLEIAHIYTHRNLYDGATLTRVSTFIFAKPNLPAEANVQDLDEAAIMGAPLGKTPTYPTGKIGIQLEANQNVRSLVLLFEGLQYPACPDGKVESELTKTFGGGGHLKWHGWAVSLPPPTDRFEMASVLKVDVDFNKVSGPGPDLYRGIFAVPMVFGFYPVPFEDHYALGLTTLQPDRANKVDTSVRLRS